MPAPLKGPVSSVVHRFQLGSFEVATILDGTVVRAAIKPPFSMNRSEAEIAALAATHHVPADRFEHGFVPTLVNTGDALVLFDVGFGEMGAKMGAGHLRARMYEIGYSPQDVDLVVFTHCHPDHIAGVVDGDARAFPNARYAIGRREYEAWESGDGIPESRTENRDLFLKLMPHLKEDMTFLEPGDIVRPGIEAVGAFGHSPGHMMYKLSSAGAEALIWADVANHYVFSVADPAAEVAFDDDRAAAIATRERVLAEVAEAGTLIIGHHMPFPSLGYVERDGGRFRWVSATYQTRV